MQAKNTKVAFKLQIIARDLFTGLIVFPFDKIFCNMINQKRRISHYRSKENEIIYL